MAIKQRHSYTLAEFRAWRRRAVECPNLDEQEHRRMLGEQSDRILAGQQPLPVPVEELIDQSRRYGG